MSEATEEASPQQAAQSGEQNGAWRRSRAVRALRRDDAAHVCEDIEPRLREGLYAGVVAGVVGDKALDADLGLAELEQLDRRGKVLRAAVVQIVAVDRRQHDVVDAPFGHRHGRIPRLGLVERRRRRVGLHRAELAAARARVSHQHDRRRAAVPALPDVWALRLLAHSRDLFSLIGLMLFGKRVLEDFVSRFLSV